ncbi:hypothetical protein DZC78_04200 [Olleya aquimaris]|nr:hypothetical protein DZC78_04200 [Olleya aquimaris]
MKKMVTVGQAKFWTDYDNILYFEFTKNQSDFVLDLNTAKKYFNGILQISEGMSMSSVIDLRGFRGTFSTEAAKFIAKNSLLNNSSISQAFITNSMATKLLIASYKRIYDPIIPFKVCNDLEVAKQFCLETSNQI